MAATGNDAATVGAHLTAYTARKLWVADRPKALVFCCSDGRLQESIDEFLSSYLDIIDYDRMLAPGGPGVISEVGAADNRTHQYRSDLEFLLEAHSFNKIVLIFHGAAEDGPEHSICAHYRRILPGRPYSEIIARHDADRKDVVNYLYALRPSLEILTYRAEVHADHSVRFLDLTPTQV